MKKKSNGSKTNTLLKCQTRFEVPDEKLLNIFESLSLPSFYKTIYLLDSVTPPNWIQNVEAVSLNVINFHPMPFIASSNILVWNNDDDNPLLDGTGEKETVQVLQINTFKFF